MKKSTSNVLLTYCPENFLMSKIKTIELKKKFHVIINQLSNLHAIKNCFQPCDQI